jgi:hypothetical protein
VSPARGRAAPRISERSVVEAAARYLEAGGYRVYVDVDGTDYFDLVARRGDEVGLVEAKVGDRRKVVVQALKRRAWGTWGAVVVPSVASADRIREATQTGRPSALGVWVLDGAGIRVVRAARDWVSPGTEDPYAPLRERFRRVLDAVDRGDLPQGVSWDGLLREVRFASGGRGFAEWRLDEPGPPEG